METTTARSAPPPLTTTGWRQTTAGGILRAARPRQWFKNVLVLAAPVAAGTRLGWETVVPLLGVFVGWCLVASATYLLNDVHDAEADRLHERKCHRPVAAGLVLPSVAGSAALALLLCGFAAAIAVHRPGAAGVLASYVAVTLAYTYWLKDEPVVELLVVASGFVLRAISGGVAAGVPLSNWFLIVASSGSLFMVAGKRQAEIIDLRDDRGAHRATLDVYSLSFLRYVRSVSSSLAIAAYCLWAFEKAEAAGSGVLFQLSIVPFVAAILRYALLVEQGHGGAPEDVVLGDRTIQVLGLAWALVFAVGVYTA